MTLSSAVLAALDAAALAPSDVTTVAARALAEDLGGGHDVTTVATVPADATGRLDFVARAAGVLAGAPVAAAVIELAGAGPVQVELPLSEGSRVLPGQAVLYASGSVRDLLTAERSALNLLCHLSGIATVTRQWVHAVEGTGARIRDTRKTTPGLRLLEKYAVRCGGGVNHRLGLWDAALVKDNHVVAAGGVRQAFDAVRAADAGIDIEVECDDMDQVREAVEAGADLVLLDNMTLAELRSAVRVAAGRARLEASGGLTLATAHAVAATGVDYLAVGALTHSAPALDIGADLRTADTAVSRAEA